MAERTLIAIPCKLYRGMFSSERVFEVRLANGQEYVSIAPRHFCWNEHGEFVAKDEATHGASEGFLAARLVEELDENQVSVAIPDGQVIAVTRDQVRARPKPIIPPGPMQRV